MNKEFNGFDDMVEALEENEDMVECKECFDLVPKVDCERAEVGYICPTCRGLRTAPVQARFVDPYDSYTQDFPEVTEYDPDSVVEYEKEPGLGDALTDLIKDEYEAIEGYEVADETVQHADIDEDEKDEILDTLDHIKEEEEEHIDELKELCPECDPVAEPEIEPEKLEEAADDEVADEADSAVCEKLDIDLSNCIESSDMEIWGVEPVGEGTYKAVLLKRFENVSFRGNDEIDKVESEMFDLGGLFVFYFGKDGMPKLDRWDPELLRSLSNCEIIFEDDRYDQACERTLNRSTSQTEGLKEAANEEEVEEIPEEESPEEEAEDSEENENEEVSDLESAYEAALEIANESGVGQVFGYARKETEEFVAIEPFEVDDPEAVEDDLMAVYDDVAYAYVAYPEKELEESLFENVQLHEAEVGKTREFADKVKKKAHSLFRKHTKADVNLDDIFTKGYYFEVNNRGAGNVNSYRVGGKQINGLTARTLADAEKIGKAAAKALASSRIEIKLMAKEVDIEDPNIKKIVADKYKWTIVTYHGGTERNNVEGINKELKNLELPTRDLEDAEASYDIDVVKKQLLQTLGKKLDLEKAKYIYSQESLNTYSEEYDELVGAIDAVETMEEIEDLELNTRVNEIKDLLKKKDRNSNKTDNKAEEEGEDESLESEEDDLEQLRAKALELLGEKKDAAGYTEDSYSAYSAKYEDCLRKIKAAKKPTTFKDQYIPALPRLVQQMNALLKEIEGDEDPNLDDDNETGDSTETNTDTEDTKTDETDGTTDETGETDTTGDTTEEPADETPDEETTETTGEEKISEISDDRLIKLYQVLSGRQISSNAGVAKSQLKRLRQKLASLGEGLDNNSSDEELLEVLQSEAEAIKSLKDTQASLKSAADGIKNMTSAMREEYHKYANPAELKVMEDLEAIVDAAKNDALHSMRNWGIDISESDSQGWMSGNNEYSYQFMLDYEDIDEGEEEDIQDQLQNLVENAILSQYTLPPELSKISVSVALPDRDIAYEDEDGEELQDVKRASLFVDVTFARNLF